MKTNWLIVAALLVVPLAHARAQSDYPTRPVQIIIDSAAGSANDATARILADKLSHIWGQQALIINRPGAGGAISAKAASQAPNDGYTLYIPATSPFLTLPGASGSSTQTWQPARIGALASLKLWSMEPSLDPITSSTVTPFSASTALTSTARSTGGRS